MRGGLVMRLHARAGFSWLLIGCVLFSFQGCAEKDTSVYEPDVTPPSVSGLTHAGGRVSWSTDEACFCMLVYGTRPGVYEHYGYHVADGGETHHVDLLDVEPGQYYARVISTDRAGNTSTSDDIIIDITSDPAHDNLVYTMVDVGWGDCHFLEFPGGTTVMVDAGYGDGGDYPHAADLFSFLNARGIGSPDGIDFMIATHNHADHYGGFLSLIPIYKNTLFLGPALAYSSVFESVDGVLNASGVPRDSLTEGQTNRNTEVLMWDEEHGVEVKVLSAGAGRLMTPEEADDAINNDSVVLKITYGSVDILLNGDAEEFAEQLMVKNYGNELDCEVLKVGHHANDDASSAEFLERATPRVGFISNSMQENDGVFDQTVINALRQHNVDYFVTDRAYLNAGRYDEPEHGNVTLTTDGASFIVWTWD